MEIRYILNGPVPAQDVIEVYRSSGLRRPVDDAERIAEMYSHSNVVVSAWAGERLVGVGRGISDQCYCCYLADLAVHADFQKKGIGKQIIEEVKKAIGPKVMLLLLAAPEAMEYYPKIGFEKMDKAWWIPRKF